MLKYFKIKEINFNNQKLDYHNFNEPIVFRNNCKNNLAYKQWNIHSLPVIFKREKLPVEVYKNENNYKSTIIEDEERYYKMKNIIKHFQSNKKPYIYCAEVNLNEYKNLNLDKYFNNFNVTKRKALSHLLYFGNNARTNCHLHVHDDYLLNQIFGRKTVYLFDYFDNNLEKNNLFSNLSNFIKKDFFKLDHSKMKIYKVVLNPGDSLSIPPWWWHATIGEGINCSLTVLYPRHNLLYLLNKPSLYNDFIYSTIYNYLDYIEEKYDINIIDNHINQKIIRILILLPIIICIILIIIVILFFKNYK